eukprot:5263149-Prymnesium_polylepis.1
MGSVRPARASVCGRAWCDGAACAHLDCHASATQLAAAVTASLRTSSWVASASCTADCTIVWGGACG